MRRTRIAKLVEALSHEDLMRLLACALWASRREYMRQLLSQ